MVAYHNNIINTVKSHFVPNRYILLNLRSVLKPLYYLVSAFFGQYGFTIAIVWCYQRQ